MASIRKVKQDFSKSISSIVGDCFLYLNLFPSQEAEIVAIIEEAISLKSGGLKALNAIPETKKLRRGYYTRLRSELNAQLLTLINQLCAIHKK